LAGIAGERALGEPALAGELLVTVVRRETMGGDESEEESF
jgi:hypothetical protein